MNHKQKLLAICQKSIQDKIRTIEQIILLNKESLNSETKSSAGDKHETGRAMLQLEMEKAGKQLIEVQKTNNTLQKIDMNIVSNKVRLGSIVSTNLGSYFIAISQGQIKVSDSTYFVISAQSPIGKLLLGKSINDTVSFRNQEIKILEIL